MPLTLLPAPPDPKFEMVLHKNQHTQRKLLNFENWCKFGFQMSKIIGTFLIFFSFLKPPHYTNSQNSIISFGYVDF